MTDLLERDIDQILAPYSFHQMFLRAPFEHAAEVAHILLGPTDPLQAKSERNPRQVECTVNVEALGAALESYGTVGNIHRWAAVIETRDPNWSWIIDGTESYTSPGNYLLAATAGYIMPPAQDCIVVDINRDSPLQYYPDPKKYTTDARLMRVWMYDDHPLAPTAPTKDQDSYAKLNFWVGIDQGEYRFQRWDTWPHDPRWAFPGLERLRTKRGPLRKRFTTDDLNDAAHLFGLDPFNRDFYTGRFIKIIWGNSHDTTVTPEEYNKNLHELVRLTEEKMK